MIYDTGPDDISEMCKRETSSPIIAYKRNVFPDPAINYQPMNVNVKAQLDVRIPRPQKNNRCFGSLSHSVTSSRNHCPVFSLRLARMVACLLSKGSVQSHSINLLRFESVTRELAKQ